VAKARQGDPRDPRFRPYRIAMYSLYIAFCGVFCVLVIVGVVQSVREMTPARSKDGERTLSVRECVEGADALWGDLEQHRKDLTQNRPASTADDNWSVFRVEWLRKLRQLDAQCATDSHSREPLQKLFARLEQVMDLYTTHAVQYAGEVGSGVDALRSAFDTARTELPVGKLPSGTAAKP
jgi:hypothetical protein